MSADRNARVKFQTPDIQLESALWTNGITRLAGIDEAGRGAWAGPVTAAAVVLPPDSQILRLLEGVRDSKQLSPKKRATLAPVIKEWATAWAVGWADHREIDEFGIVPATRLAMMRAIGGLLYQPDHLLIDALFLPELETGQTSLIKGDQRCLSIASASILAKTARDAWMVKAHQDYPVYRFDLHKGYGTQIHRQALEQAGVCSLHRQTYEPVRKILDDNRQ